jgi:DNA-binding SARP family transcriptional activator
MRAQALLEPQSSPSPSSILHLYLIGGFGLRRDHQSIDLPLGAQRLLAFLALQDRQRPRAYVAGMLWPDIGEERAGGRLRSAVWRLGHTGCQLVDGSRTHLRLAQEVHVDWRGVAREYRRLLDDSADMAVDLLTLVSASGDLLPEWYEDWVIIERERFRQLRLHALEALCVRLTKAGPTWLAVEVGLAAVAAEPLRESAHRALIEAHLAEGNRSEALRQLDLYRRLLRDELGLEPSESIAQLCAQGKE